MIHADNEEGVIQVEGCMRDVYLEWSLLTGSIHKMFANKIGAEETNAMFTQGLFAAVASSEELMKGDGESV